MNVNKYWDADELLMSNEMVTCIADQDIVGINFQDKLNGVGQFNDDSTTKEGSKLELPLWYALILRDNVYVNINHPKYLTDKFYNLLQADPTIVNVKLKNLYFYDICLILIPFLDEEERKWPKIIAETIHKRFLHLLKNASNVIYENYSLTKLTSLKEKTFYDKMVRINKNIKFFLENYENNNKLLDNIIENKKLSRKVKKVK